MPLSLVTLRSRWHFQIMRFAVLFATIFTLLLSALFTHSQVSRSLLWAFTLAPATFTLESNITDAYYIVAPLVFDSLHGLLKQWPNTYAPNGHSIVVGTVVPFTPLYNGKHGPGLPETLQFFAFDA